jgi:hypothetical protein
LRSWALHFIVRVFDEVGERRYGRPSTPPGEVRAATPWTRATR